MVRRCLFLLFSKNLFADHYQSSGNLVAATLRLMEIQSRREHRLASTSFVECHVGLAVRSSAWSLSRPKYAASQNSRDFSATHKKMVGNHRTALLLKYLFADHYQPSDNLVAPILRHMEIQSRLEPRLASACFVERPVGLAVRNSAWSRSRPESAASQNGRDHSATHEKLVGYHRFALFLKDIFADHYQSSDNLVMTILRRIRKWSETAAPLCCQRIYLPTGLGFRSVARP